MPGGGQWKHSLNNVAQMHTHESPVAGKRNHRRGLLVEVHFGNVNQEDGLFSFVRAVTGDPLGNGSLLNRGASNASLERERKCRPPSVSVFFFIYFLSRAILGKDKLIGYESGKPLTRQERKLKKNKKNTASRYHIFSVDGSQVGRVEAE